VDDEVVAEGLRLDLRQGVLPPHPLAMDLVVLGKALPGEVLWVLLRGRVGERLGERDRAIQAYAWVAGMWRNADPALQPYVREARDGVARLTGEKR